MRFKRLISVRVILALQRKRCGFVLGEMLLSFHYQHDAPTSGFHDKIAEHIS